MHGYNILFVHPLLVVLVPSSSLPYVIVIVHSVLCKVKLMGVVYRLLVTFRCRYEDTLVFYPINSTMFAFRFQSFKFIGSNRTFVYIHCEAYVCEKS